MKIFKILALLFIVVSSHSVCSQVSQDSRDSGQITQKDYVLGKLPLSPKTNVPFRYYYYPNLQAYFDTVYNVYYYKMNGEWIINDVIPPLYGGYSIFKNRKVILEDFIEDKPYELIQLHKAKFPYTSKGRLTKEEA